MCFDGAAAYRLYMVDIKRQAPNVARMKMLGCRKFAQQHFQVLKPLKDATNEELRLD
jgi:tryptophan synthase beta subunit